MARKLIKKRTLVPVRIEPDLLKSLDVIGIKQNLYRSELIREAIRDLIIKYEALEKARTMPV